MTPAASCSHESVVHCTANAARGVLIGPQNGALTGKVDGLRPRPHTYYDMTNVTRADHQTEFASFALLRFAGYPCLQGSCWRHALNRALLCLLFSFCMWRGPRIAILLPYGLSLLCGRRVAFGINSLPVGSIVTCCSHTFHKMARAPCKICSASQFANRMIANQEQAMSLGCEAVADHCAAAGPCVESAPGHTPWGALEHKGFMSWVQQTWSAAASRRAAQAGPKTPGVRVKSSGPSGQLSPPSQILRRCSRQPEPARWRGGQQCPSPCAQTAASAHQ